MSNSTPQWFIESARLLSVLEEIEEIADQYADCDDTIPNDWMRVLTRVRDAIAAVRHG